jgi:phosphatidylserine/phosphatidylglycerophosphate/cardiolipin synthase-like enzyme
MDEGCGAGDLPDGLDGGGGAVSTSATGRVLRGAGGLPWVGLAVTATDASALLEDVVLGRGRTGADGGFTIGYADDGLFAALGPRAIVVEVADGVGRRLARVELEDVAGPVLTVPDIVVRPADGEGFAVTLGTGAAAFVSAGNAVTPLVDNLQAWGHLADLFAAAGQRIEIMQMEFEVPSRYAADPGAETPAMVFRFGAPSPAIAPRAVNASDERPERVLVGRARDGQVEARILLNRVVLGARGVAVGTLLGLQWLPLLPLILLALLIGPLLFELGLLTTTDEVRRYFGQAGRPEVTARGMRTSVFARTHAKLAIVDGAQAVSVASPFMQSYFDDERHRIEDPRRGGARGYPVHDVSMAVRGPAVADLHEAFRLHWNTADPDAPPVAAIDRPAPGAGGVALQVVRTLPAGRFTAPAEGETGVLEAYLRAIAAAGEFIYLENQYFTNSTVGAALVAALKDPARPDLQVIMLVNIDPDVPRYPGYQNALITRIRAALSVPELQRFGVFTRWTHETGGARPRIVPNYVHSKLGVVDDRWATVGSANLDGSSLDYTQMFHGLFGDVRNSEVNLVVLPEPAAPATPVVQALRRRLWAEHLGFATAQGEPDPDDAALAAPPADGGWLALWNQRAQQKAGLLRTNPAAAGPGHVLPWPAVDSASAAPREHLAQLLVGGQQLDVVRKTRSFDFATGAWSSPIALDG